MYTQCPECLTVYAIDEDALQTSLGIVRCGRCDKRFDALRTLSDTLPIEPLAPLLEQEPSERAPTLTEAVPPAAFESAARKARPKISPSDREAAAVSPASSRDAASGDADDWFSDLESELATPPEPADDHASFATDTDIENWTLEFPSESDLTETHADNAAGTARDDAPDGWVDPDPSLAMGSVVEAPDIVQPAESSDQAETFAVDEPVAAGVPDEIPIDDHDSEAEPARAPVYVPPRHRISRTSMAWALGCLLLALLLAVQLAWANRIELFRSPATQPWMASICQTLPCNLPLIKDTSQLELLSRDVRPDPNAAGALTITATVRNNAVFSQPWPVVVVELNDLDNKPVAMRRFRPSEYMTDPARRDAGIAPGATAVVAFEVADPGRRAVAFQFGFE